MALEDFTTYTEVDGQGCLTVIANKITALQIRNSNTDSYVYDDKGAAHFGNFEHLHGGENYNQGVTDNGAYCLVWGISDTIDDFANWTNGVFLYYSLDPGINKHWLRDRTGGGWGNLDGYNGTRFTRYWYTTERNGTTLTCKIYSDGARTVLEDTLTIVCINTTLRYMYAVSTLANTDTDDMNAYVYDLDLQEAGIETHTPSDTAKANDALIFKAEVPINDTAKASDNISFFKGLKFAINDTAKANDSLSTKVSLVLSDTAKASDVISFITIMKYAIIDTAKASDVIGFVWAGMGGIFKYPIKMFKDTLHKYTKNHSNMQKYSSEKNSGQKYRRE